MTTQNVAAGASPAEEGQWTSHRRRSARVYVRARALRLIPVVLLLAPRVPAGAQQQERPPASQPPKPGTNLVFNGDFEQPDETGKLPANWTTKHPDNVRRIERAGEFSHVVEMTGDEQLMGTYGTDLTSEKVPIKAKTAYRCTGYTRSTGPSMIVFIKGYATVTRRVKGELRTFDDEGYQMRKQIKPSADWQPFNLDFDLTPTESFSPFQHEIKYVRIRLWGYWPAGTCWFANMRFEEVGPLPPERIRHPGAVTHTGVKPRLSEKAEQPDDVGRFEEEQTWIDAANAFRADDFARALPLAEQLVAHAPHKGTYRVLLARVLAKLEHWTEADAQAAWFLDENVAAGAPPAGAGEAPAKPNVAPAPRGRRNGAASAPSSAPGQPATKPAGTQPAAEIESWQRDWALVVRAEAYWHTGRADEAREILKRALRPAASPHAQQAAEELRQQIERGDR